VTFEFAGNKYALQFKYETELEKERGLFRRTYCTLFKYVESQWLPSVIEGEALCVPEDRYVKETGRKLALTRALSSVSKEFRTAAWQAYHSRRNNENKGS
jgi:hypothetical protein